MPFTIITTTNARLDIMEAIEWEKKRSPDLAQRFLEDLDKKLMAISITPGAGSIRYDNVRCTATKVFSYLIHYTVNDGLKQITILRVLHTSRKPIR